MPLVVRDTAHHAVEVAVANSHTVGVDGDGGVGNRQIGRLKERTAIACQS
jgi:hypothetical protein